MGEFGLFILTVIAEGEGAKSNLVFEKTLSFDYSDTAGDRQIEYYL